MILLVFEGKDREVRIYKTIRELFFKDKINDDIYISYCSNIYSLYCKMKELNIFEDEDSDIIQLLKQEAKKHKEIPNTLEQFEDSDSFSEIYLFFDYDIKKPDQHNTETIDKQNDQIKEMLAFFNDETRNGKLYINYPMIEAIRYFKTPLPDANFYTYTTDLFIGKKFKQVANDDSFYKNLDFITFKVNKHTSDLQHYTENEKEKIKKNWNMIKDLHIKKAHFICMGTNIIPTSKDLLNQNTIFKYQISKYIVQNQISILSGFPMFLYEYFG